MTIRMHQRPDRLIECENCQMFGQPTTLFNRIGGPTGVVHHLIDHIAQGELPDRWTVIVVQNWLRHDLFHEFEGARP